LYFYREDKCMGRFSLPFTIISKCFWISHVVLSEWLLSYHIAMRIQHVFALAIKPEVIASQLIGSSYIQRRPICMGWGGNSQFTPSCMQPRRSPVTTNVEKILKITHCIHNFENQKLGMVSLDFSSYYCQFDIQVNEFSFVLSK
jgi:hypothetical protein